MMTDVQKFPELTVRQLVTINNLLSEFIGARKKEHPDDKVLADMAEVKIKYRKELEKGRHELASNAIALLDQFNLFVGVKDGKLGLYPQSSVKMPTDKPVTVSHGHVVVDEADEDEPSTKSKASRKAVKAGTSLADYVDSLLYAGGTWEEIAKEAAKEAKRRGIQEYSDGKTMKIRRHIRSRENQGRVFKALEWTDERVKLQLVNPAKVEKSKPEVKTTTAKATTKPKTGKPTGRKVEKVTKGGRQLVKATEATAAM